MRKRVFVGAITVAALMFATSAEAGPIRNVLSKLRAKPKAAVKLVVKIVGGCVGKVCRR